MHPFTRYAAGSDGNSSIEKYENLISKWGASDKKPMRIPRHVARIIHQLNSDSKIVGSCPTCGCAAPMIHWNLFYTDSFPPEAANSIATMKQGIVDLKDEIRGIREKATTLAAKKSLEVNMGKVVERVVPALADFPYRTCDCRPLFDPIDYIVFQGLGEKGLVDEIRFIDVKTGYARLSERERLVKNAVERGRVTFGLY